MAEVPAPRGPAKGYDVEQLFQWFYNAGQRRTLQDVEKFAATQGVEVSYSTLRRYADEFDWFGRAEALDEETRRIVNRRLANTVAQVRMREIEAIATLQTKFMRRLVPSTQERPNPAEIQPIDLEPRDFIDLGKFFELITGGVTSRVGQEGESTALDEMARAITEMDQADTQQALPAGEG
jgi:hypothetical protein